MEKRNRQVCGSFGRQTKKAAQLENRAEARSRKRRANREAQEAAADYRRGFEGCTEQCDADAGMHHPLYCPKLPQQP